MKSSRMDELIAGLKEHDQELQERSAEHAEKMEAAYRSIRENSAFINAMNTTGTGDTVHTNAFAHLNSGKERKLNEEFKRKCAASKRRLVNLWLNLQLSRCLRNKAAGNNQPRDKRNFSK
ncbi:MAG: hypothetical protein EA357_10530 [Micavibrio sp.]|nr:MAG: hypothetical protein EA357_10530 [Micavibrio sp.]